MYALLNNYNSNKNKNMCMEIFTIIRLCLCRWEFKNDRDCESTIITLMCIEYTKKYFGNRA